MRRTNKAVVEDEAQIDLTPMLDVVFIMLIFFIVTASFIKEAGIEVNRPEASTSQPKENVNILIAINANNEIWMDKRRIDARAVRANIERLHAENPEAPVVIQPHPESRTETMIHIFDSARQAGVYNVSLAQ